MTNEEHLKIIVKKCKTVYKYQLEMLKDDNGLCTDMSKAGYLTGIIFGLSEGVDIWNKEKLEQKILKLEDTYKKQEDRYLCGMTEGLALVMRMMAHDDKVYNMMSMLAGSLVFKK